MELPSHPLLTRLARLLAVEVPADASVEAVEVGLRGSLPWPFLVAVLLGLLVFAGVLVALYFTERGTIGPVRRVLAILLRLSLVVLLLVLLLRPVLSLVLKRERPRGVVVLLDNSQSMKQQDRRLTDADKLRVAIAKGLLAPEAGVDGKDLEVRGGPPTAPPRADLVRGVLTHPELRLIERLEKLGPVRPYLFGGDLRSPRAGASPAQALLADFTAEEPRTALAEGVVKVLQSKEGELPSAIVLITDGQDNASKFTHSELEVLREAAAECKGHKVPLHVYGVGTAEGGALQLKE